MIRAPWNAVRSTVRWARACVERTWLTLGVRLRLTSALRAAAELQRFAALAATWPTDTRRVFTLRTVYDFTIPEIAAHLGLSERAVEHHLITAALACGRHFTDSAGTPVAPGPFSTRAEADAAGAGGRIDFSDSAASDVRTKCPGGRPCPGAAGADPATGRR